MYPKDTRPSTRDDGKFGNDLDTRDRLPGLTIRPLVKLDDWRLVLNCSRRVVERLRSSGRLPAPDLLLGRSPRWKAETVERWLNEQAARKAVRS